MKHVQLLNSLGLETVQGMVEGSGLKTELFYEYCIVCLLLVSLLLQPSAVETDSEEYRSHNDTESDIEVEKGVVVIQDLEAVQVQLNLIFRSLCLEFRFKN